MSCWVLGLLVLPTPSPLVQGVSAGEGVVASGFSVVAVQVWVSQLLVLGSGVVGWVLPGVRTPHSWLRAWWCLFASRAGLLGDADGGGALGVTRCRGRGAGGRGVVGDGTLARHWWGW